jgi:hypothetical protein
MNGCRGGQGRSSREVADCGMNTISLMIALGVWGLAVGAWWMLFQ